VVSSSFYKVSEKLSKFLNFFVAFSTEINPTFTPSTDVVLNLFTRTNRNAPVRLQLDAATVRNSPFLASRPTRIITHGWLGDGEIDFITGAVPALLDAGDFNVIVVDWSAGSQTINYPAAVLRVSPIGQFVASFVDFLHENDFLQFAQLKVVGFSMGAHIVGHIGKNVRRGQIDTIIGLDPGDENIILLIKIIKLFILFFIINTAGPLFSVNNPNNRLAATDARYVEAIHTNGGGTGIGAPITQADFFPNGGSSQPGCLTPTCSHDRAVDFYLEGLRSNRFFGFRCNNLEEAQNEICAQQPGAWISSEPSNSNQSDARGIFHFRTNRLSPFAQGPTRPF
jgi:pancreatic triacylglycerol lipase